MKLLDRCELVNELVMAGRDGVQISFLHADDCPAKGARELRVDLNLCACEAEIYLTVKDSGHTFYVDYAPDDDDAPTGVH